MRHAHFYDMQPWRRTWSQSMRIVDHDELPSHLESELQLLRLSVGWNPRDFSRLGRAKSAGYPAPDYLGLMRWRTAMYSRPSGCCDSLTPSPMATWRPSRLSSASSRGRLPGTYALLAGCWTRYTGGSERPAAGSRSCGRANRSRGTASTNPWDTGTSTALISPRRGHPDGSATHWGAMSREWSGTRKRRSWTEYHATATRRSGIGFTPRPRGLLRSLLKFGLLKTESFRWIIGDDRPVGYLELREPAPAWVKVSRGRPHAGIGGPRRAPVCPGTAFCGEVAVSSGTRSCVTVKETLRGRKGTRSPPER